MSRDELLAEISAMRLAKGHYVVVGGAAMALRGMRETQDIDLVVTPKLFEQLARGGWTTKQRPDGRPGLRLGRAEAYLDVNTASVAPQTQWLIDHAECVQGIPVVDLETLLGWKRGYGRDKDNRDIEILVANLRRSGDAAAGGTPNWVNGPEQQRFLANIRSNHANDQILARLPELGLPDSLLVAGSLFQTVWNVQCGKAPDAGILDYDIFYHDASDLSWQAEDAAIVAAGQLFEDLGVPVQVRNQARVHLWYESKFGIPCNPLVSSQDGIDHFLNQSSCFGIRAGTTGLELYAPFGFSDLEAMVVRPNRRRNLPEVYAAKAARWKIAWPRLTVVPWDDEKQDAI